MNEIKTIDELNAFLQNDGQPRLLFKHSTRCPVSSWAFGQFEALLQSVPTVKYGLVKVVEHRDVSNQIAQLSGVQHESPQALVLLDGKVQWHGSHSDLTTGALERAVSSAVG